MNKKIPELLDLYSWVCDTIRDTVLKQIGYDEYYNYWIGGSWWILCIADDNYLNMTDMITILTNGIREEVVIAWWNHITEYSDNYINLDSFSKMYDGEWFSDRYKEKVEAQRAYWLSPEWKAKESEMFEELKHKYLNNVCP